VASTTKKEQEEFPVGTSETLLMTLRPHPLSFLRYYSVGIVLLLWIVLTYFLHDQGWLEWEPLGDDLNALLPALFLALGGVIVGKWLVDDFNKGFQALYWLAVIVLLVVTGLFIWYWDDSGMAFTFAFLFGITMGVLGIVFAEFYRRAFKYLVTNQRIVLRFKLLSIEETNMRFEKIEDFEIVRSLWFRLAGLGVIRPYTGSEDAKVDENRDFHGPKEALYGIRRPNEVKRQLIEIILERDQWDKQMVELLEDQKKEAASPAPKATPAAPAPPEPTPAPAPAPAPAQAPAPAPATPEPAPAQEPGPKVAYYQPSPPPEPEPEPAPTSAPVRNYERIEPSRQAPPGEEEMSPIPPEEDPEPGPAPNPVRRMYPEAEEPDTQLQMEDTRRMDFESGERPQAPREPDRTAQEEEGWRSRDSRKPRSL
jgi:hypothetical protein